MCIIWRLVRSCRCLDEDFQDCLKMVKMWVSEKLILLFYPNGDHWGARNWVSHWVPPKANAKLHRVAHRLDIWLWSKSLFFLNVFANRLKWQPLIKDIFQYTRCYKTECNFKFFLNRTTYIWLKTWFPR